MAKLEEGKGSSETSFNVMIFPLSNVTDSPLDNLPKIGPGLIPKSNAFCLLNDLFFCFGIHMKFIAKLLSAFVLKGIIFIKHKVFNFRENPILFRY